MRSLPDRARVLLARAADAYAEHPPSAERLTRLLDGFGEPLSIAVTGPPNTGKSTLIEALGWHFPAQPRRVRFAEAGTDADAVLDLVPHPSAVPRPEPRGPYHTIVVLARADELSAGHVDGLGTAKILARRRHRDPVAWQACQAVVAVSGRIGLAGHTHGAPDHAALALLAGYPARELAAHLLSADRFLAPQLPVPVEPATRTDLLDRLGITGLRLAVTLSRQASGDGPEQRTPLGQQLVQRSGLADLADAIEDLFLSRPAVLKAHAALAALENLVRTRPPRDCQPILAGLDRARANAHELRELRLLAGLRAGRTGLPAPLADEAYRLVGGRGTGIADRLDLPEDAPHPYAWAAATDAMHRWRAYDHDRVNAVVVRSCEAIVAELGTGR